MIESLPAVNASLNATSALLLIVGWILIHQKRVAAHRACMIAAFVVSALFLACYLVYHYHIGHRPFPGPTEWKKVYLAVLIPHIALAVGMLPLIAITFHRAFRGDFARHRKIARWTLPIWLYVSVTGVVVYAMLYLIDWGPAVSAVSVAAPIP